MACCGGARKTVPRITGNQVQTYQQVDPLTKYAELLYTGNRIGSFSITGPTSRRSYRVSRHKPTIYVDLLDYEWFLDRPDFKLVRLAQDG